VTVYGKQDLISILKKHRIASVTGLLIVAGLLVAGLSQYDNSLARGCYKARKTADNLQPFAVGSLKSFSPVNNSIDLSPIRFSNENGSTISVADFRGRTILLNIWATWCEPCKEEMPALDDLQAKLGGDDFEVVPVSVDRGEGSRPKAYYQENNLVNLALYSDSSTKIFNRLQKMGLVFGLPNSILIDRSGCALGVLLGAAQWNSPDAIELIRAAV